MLKRLAVSGPGARVAAAMVQSVYPHLITSTALEPDVTWFTFEQEQWGASTFDPTVTDDALARALSPMRDFGLRVVGRQDLVRTALEVVTRYQRHVRGGNAATDSEKFQRALARHEQLHDRRKPLVAADWDHALDVWRWVLRLCPEASLALQVSALFHDVERLLSETEVRVEQHSVDYTAFKNAHAAAGAECVSRWLAELEFSDGERARVADLVRGHERPGLDSEARILNQADALSFFSLNACGFLRYYGVAHTRRKIAYTLARLGPSPSAQLRGIRHRADVAALIGEVLARTDQETEVAC